jgi:hypothetical protein
MIEFYFFLYVDWFPAVPQYFKHYCLYFRMVLEISQSLLSLEEEANAFPTHRTP